MAESIFVSIIKTVKTKLSSPALKEAVFESDLDKLSNALTTIQYLQLDAEKKKATNRSLRQWLDKLKEVIYRLDDVIDRFLSEKSDSSKVYFPYFNNYLGLIKFGPKIRKARERLEEVLKAKSKFNLVEHPARDSNYSNRSYVTRPVIGQSDSDIVGRESDKKTIIEFLVEDHHGSKDVSILCIVGIGGSGKTTLAKMVYNDEKVKEHFPLKIWENISDDFDVVNLRKNIVVESKRNGSSSVPSKEDDLKIRSRQDLKDLRFLLVLDAVMYEDWKIWDELQDLLSSGSRGSKIIITTRSHLVTSIPSSVHTHMLPQLKFEESMALFSKSAFDEGVEIQNHDVLMNIGNEIVKKCRGLPLALIFVGSLLHMNTNGQDWESVNTDEMWKSYEQDISPIVPALNLSYDRLPSYLKHCFAILSLHPKHYPFRGIDLIQLWMAQGLITPIKEGDELEKIGADYVKELWSRSFIKQVEGDYDLYARFNMHDLVHDLALIISQNECWSVNFQTKNVPKMVRHVSFYDADLSNAVHKSLLGHNVYLRTILFPLKGVGTSDNSFVKIWITRFKYLRVLDLSDTSFETLPDFTGKLKYARLLSLADNRAIKKLPESLTKLKNLQSLRLHGCTGLEELPKDFGHLTNLRFLYITTKQESLDIGGLINLRFLSVSGCVNLKSLDENVMIRLTALRIMWINDCKSLVCFPSGLNKLMTNLKINDCPHLNERCQKDTGEDWPKIAYIPDITIDSPKIRNAAS